MYIVVFTSKPPSVAYTRERTLRDVYRRIYVKNPVCSVCARMNRPIAAGFCLCADRRIRLHPVGADIWLGGLIRDNISAGCRCAQTSMRRQGALRDLCLGSGFTLARRISERGCLSCANRFGSPSPCLIFCAADIISYACVCLLGGICRSKFSLELSTIFCVFGAF